MSIVNLSNTGDEFKKSYIRASSEQFLYLTILPTERCNFRCKYCYEDFKIGKMPSSVVNGVTAFLENTLPNISNISVSWFGGEPTLNIPAVSAISNVIKERSDADDSFVYSGHMTTNGYLLDRAMFDELIGLGITRFQITLDGDEQAHDQTRVMASGRGSFERIWNNLLSYTESPDDFEINLRIHISRHNVESVERLSKMLKRHLLIDDRFKVNFEKIKFLGDGVATSNPKDHIPENGDERVDALLEEFNGMLSNTILDVRNGNPYICYASMPRQLLIRADGRIGKCTVMLNDARNDLGRIHEDGSLEIAGEKIDLWTRGFDSLDMDELRCPAIRIPALSPAN